jgi:tetratricopeptide (TPR) repeat protein/transcriptional regulator with XRE-family HTH domain
VFGEQVAAHRHRLGLTQEELARRADLSVRAIRDLESGRVRMPRQVSVRLLADAFGLQGQEREDFIRQARAAKKRSPRAASAGESTLAPAQLPLAVPGFAGRSAQLAALDAAASVALRSRPVTVVISAVWGTAGVGKTALAVHWAHRVRSRFPDGQLYVNLRGFDPGGAVMAPAEAVRRFLDALGVPAERIPADLDAQAALYRSLLAGRRMLIVLDNARDGEQVRPLLPGVPGCLVLVTSRSELSGLVAATGAQPLSLDLLTARESWQLLAARLGEDRLATEPDAVQEIIERCARLPLALAIVAARAAAHPDFPLAALAGELREPAERLDAFADRDPGSDLRAVFSWSYQVLSPAAARLFRLLGLQPGPDISAAAAASLAGLPPLRVRAVLAELTGAHLIVEHLPHRYTFHDLLRVYAEEQARHCEDADDRREAIHRLLDHYVLTAHAASRLLHPVRDPITPVEPRPSVTAEHFTDNSAARIWFSAEHAVLLAALDHAVGTGFHAHTWQLAWSLVTFLDWQGHWHDFVATQRAAVTAAEHLGDVAAQAVSHRLLARAYGLLGRVEEAHVELQHALELYGRADDRVGQGHTHLNLAWILEQQRRHGDALEHARLALDLYVAAGYRRGQAMALNATGWTMGQLGAHREALAACEQALPIFQELGDGVSEAETWDTVGYVHHHLGDHTEAGACYRRAIALYRDLGERFLEADTLTHLGDTEHAASNAGAARDAWRQALTILNDLAHPDAEVVREKLRDLGPK